MLDTGYIKYGIKNFWFDASEPESLGGVNHTVDGVVFNNPLGQPQGSKFAAGTNEQVGMMFPWWHTKMVFDGLTQKYPDEVPVTLARSGWAGTQKFGASNWNGDLTASWTNFKKTVVAGINAQMSGLAWWTHDIGAIGDCDVSSPDYRELLIRWFQFGLVSPIFRQHGSRPVEPWLLQKYPSCKHDRKGTVCGPSGNVTYDAIIKVMNFRQQLRPYVMKLMQTVAENGEPINRPLNWDFPSDPTTWFITDQFMFGPKYMFAPITDLGSRMRPVYFPVGGDCTSWKPVQAVIHGAKECPGCSKSSPDFAPGSFVKSFPVALDELAMFECV